MLPRMHIEQMRHSLRAAREILGHEIPGLADIEIEESLWYYYFDVSKTVNYILSTDALDPAMSDSTNY